MNLFSYKIEHDYGLAPNPFGQYCTLAICKPTIRKNKNLNIGDWVIGTGSAKLNNLFHLVFAMKLEEKLTFENYWSDPRFQYKKPIQNGSMVKIFGDNIYSYNSETKSWSQENSAHSLSKNSPNLKHLKTDLSGKYVLISKEFYYFGDSCFLLPKIYRGICNDGRNMKSNSISKEIGNNFIEWLESNYKKGLHGDPINWKELNLSI